MAASITAPFVDVIALGLFVLFLCQMVSQLWRWPFPSKCLEELHELNVADVVQKLPYNSLSIVPSAAEYQGRCAEHTLTT